MKAVILAGGLGTRLSEETEIKPKPMVEIGGRPILWHIMKLYSAHGINDFIICCGYKGYAIKEYFTNYFLHTSDLTVDLKKNEVNILQNNSEPWKITIVDTGLETQTGGRLKRVQKYIEENETFCMTYGDGVSDVNITELVAFHKKSKALATLSAVQPEARFGALDVDEGDKKVKRFVEKPPGDGGYINGGFFVLSSKVLDYIEGDKTIWEREPLENLAKEGNLRAYTHNGFWRPMDTLRDKIRLQELWDKGKAPWKIWD